MIKEDYKHYAFLLAVWTFFVILLVYSTGCGRFFAEEPEIEIVPEIIEEEFPEAEEINWRQWRCCIDLCRGKEPKSVLKEIGTPYIICECKSGKVFRVTKLPRKKKTYPTR